jgi:hypothetical protein
MKSDMCTSQDEMSAEPIHIGHGPSGRQRVKNTAVRLESRLESRWEFLPDIQQLLIQVQDTAMRWWTCMLAVFGPMEADGVCNDHVKLDYKTRKRSSSSSYGPKADSNQLPYLADFVPGNNPIQLSGSVSSRGALT